MKKSVDVSMKLVNSWVWSIKVNLIWGSWEFEKLEMDFGKGVVLSNDKIKGIIMGIRVYYYCLLGI